VKVKDKPFDGKSLAAYAALQSLALIFCWVWFAALWSVAFFRFSLADLEWWLLVASACAGLYGLRPNLEKAIDAAWLRKGPATGRPSPAALTERAAQLKPIKRRIDLVFSLIVLGLLVLSLVLWFSGALTAGSGSA
jgi:hypothetical protein